MTKTPWAAVVRGPRLPKAVGKALHRFQMHPGHRASKIPNAIFGGIGSDDPLGARTTGGAHLLAGETAQTPGATALAAKKATVRRSSFFLKRQVTGKKQQTTGGNGSRIGTRVPCTLKP